MPWLQITIATNSEESERLEDALLSLGAQAVSLEDDADQPLYEPPPGATPLWKSIRVSGLFTADTDPEWLLQQIKEIMIWPSLPQYNIEEIADQDWERAWMDDFKPMKFGQRLWICPSWENAIQSDAINLILDPGLAFGTGTHPTTRLCLEWLDGIDLQGKTVIDYGCGSGVLAIAASLLGANKVWAIDLDPQALIATGQNAKKNNVSNIITLDCEQPLPDSCDILIANILANPLIELSEQLCGLLKPNGGLALSGILAEQAEQVRQSYQSHIKLNPTTQLEEWVRLDGIKLNN